MVSPLRSGLWRSIDRRSFPPRGDTPIVSPSGRRNGLQEFSIRLFLDSQLFETVRGFLLTLVYLVFFLLLFVYDLGATEKKKRDDSKVDIGP